MLKIVKKTKWRLIVFIIIFLVLLIALSLLLLPFMRNLQTPEYREMFSSWITELGFKGVILFFLLQILQIVIAVIPGGPIQIIAGAAFGAWKGLLILQAGNIAAAVIIFALVRKFGHPLIARLFGNDIINSWSFLQNEKRTAQAIFILFLITGTPKDALTYLAALTRISLVQFLVITMIARFPGIILSTLMGDSAMRGNWTLFVLVFGITGLAGILGIQFKDRIIGRFTSKTING